MVVERLDGTHDLLQPKRLCPSGRDAQWQNGLFFMVTVGRSPPGLFPPGPPPPPS